MTKKQIFRCIAFALVFCMMLVVLCDLFESDNNTNFDMRFTTYRNLEKDTVDAVFIGTSGVDRYWIAPKAYEEYGMTVYSLSSDAMPTWLFTNMIDEAYTYQNPELILIDARAYGQDNSLVKPMDARARRVLDAMNFWSINRIKTAFKTMETIHSAHEEQSRFDLSYLFSVAKYHDKWAEDDYEIKNNLGNKEHEYGGFYMSGSLSTFSEPQVTDSYDFDLYEPLDPVAEESLYELLDYVKEKNLNVLFVDTPQLRDETETGRANTLYKILDEEGIDYVNFFATDSDEMYVIDFDYEKDFYNSGHTNYYGAEKFTDYFAQYIDENYDLPDRRGDEAVAKDWDGKYDAIKEKIKADEEKLNKK